MTGYLKGEKMDESVVLKINGEETKINNFVKKILTNVNTGIVTSLTLDEKEVKSIEIEIKL